MSRPLNRIFLCTAMGLGIALNAGAAGPTREGMIFLLAAIVFHGLAFSDATDGIERSDR